MSSIESSKKRSSENLESFVSTIDTFTLKSTDTMSLRVPLSPKRSFENVSSFSSSSTDSPKRIKSEEKKSNTTEMMYKRPQPPRRPVPHSPPRLNVLKPENSDKEEIEAKFSISKSLKEPLYLSSARILNTPENSSEESFESHNNDENDDDSIDKMTSRLKSTSQEDTKLRLSITRSEGGVGTSIPTNFFNNLRSVSEPIASSTAHRTSSSKKNGVKLMQGLMKEKQRKESRTTVRTSNVIDALRIQTAERGTSSCTLCGNLHNPRHSRVCIMCYSPMCRSCKKVNMMKLAKKSWVCQNCVSCVKIQFPIQDSHCCVCTLEKCRTSRSCLLCKKHFCEVCKKEHMFKLAPTKWICNKHSMKDAFLNLRREVLDSSLS